MRQPTQVLENHTAAAPQGASQAVAAWRGQLLHADASYAAPSPLDGGGVSALTNTCLVHAGPVPKQRANLEQRVGHATSPSSHSERPCQRQHRHNT